MVLKFRKLAITFGSLFLISLLVGVLFRGPIFASDVVLTNNNTSATVVDNLSLPSQFTLRPLDAASMKLGQGFNVLKAYRIYDGDKIFGEMLLTDSSNSNIKQASNLMISHISRTFPFIVRDRYENGNGRIIYREWGKARKDDLSLNYQNLIIKNKNVNFYIILYYKNSYSSDVDHILRSVNFNS